MSDLGPDATGRRYNAPAIVALVAGVGLLLAPLPNSYRAPWVTKLLDLGHIPLFAMVTWIVWYLIGRRVILAGGLSVVLAGLLEGGQLFSGRNVDLEDALRSGLGVLLGCVGIRVACSAMSRLRGACVMLACGSLLLAWPVWDAVPVFVGAWRAYQAFPVVCDFRAPQDPARWRAYSATIHRESASASDCQWVGCMTRNAGSDAYWGGSLFPVVQDWSLYKEVCCEFSFSGEPLRILISVRDGRKVAPPAQRFDSVDVYEPGTHRVCFDLSSLRRGGRFSPLDVTSIQSFHFEIQNATATQEVHLHRIFLN